MTTFTTYLSMQPFGKGSFASMCTTPQRNHLFLLQSHPNKLFTDEILTVQRVLKNRGFEVSENEVLLFSVGNVHIHHTTDMYFVTILCLQVAYTWKYVYNLHFLRQAEQAAQKCQRGYVLRQHSPEVSHQLLKRDGDNQCSQD